MTVWATRSDGTVVTYSASATDIVDGSVAVSCSPASGSTFPIGNTTVTCGAVDGRGNAASASFKVVVRVDTVQPSVSIVDPRAGNAYLGDQADPVGPALPTTVLVGAKTIRAVATDNVGVVRVEFWVDGARQVCAREQAPFSCVWAAGAESVGEHVLEARAFDRVGNRGTDAMRVLTVPTTASPPSV